MSCQTQGAADQDDNLLTTILSVMRVKSVEFRLNPDDFEHVIYPNSNYRKKTMVPERQERVPRFLEPCWNCGDDRVHRNRLRSKPMPARH